MTYKEALTRLGKLFPGNDEGTLDYALQALNEGVRRMRDYHEIGEERLFQLGNSFKVVTEYTKWLERQQDRGVYSPGSLMEDFSMASPLFDRFLKETGTDLY